MSDRQCGLSLHLLELVEWGTGGDVQSHGGRVFGVRVWGNVELAGEVVILRVLERVQVGEAVETV